MSSIPSLTTDISNTTMNGAIELTGLTGEISLIANMIAVIRKKILK
jgi:hypothetical protein